jgi:beta-galactosidase
VYAVDDEVELFVNGASQGRKPAGAAVQNKVSFEVVYQPGKIEATGYTGSKETGHFGLVTASGPAALRLSADRDEIPSGGGGLSYVTIEIQDGAGVPVKYGEPEITVEVSGAGVLLALGSGDPLSEEPYAGTHHKAFQGRLLAVVRSAAQPGEITLTARTEGLPEAKVVLMSV